MMMARLPFGNPLRRALPTLQPEADKELNRVGTRKWEHPLIGGVACPRREEVLRPSMQHALSRMCAEDEPPSSETPGLRDPCPVAWSRRAAVTLPKLPAFSILIGGADLC